MSRLFSTATMMMRRPPIVAIMGHVDHGKTTLLDYLRKSRVAAGEAGGITQHIGAFSVPIDASDSKKTITFLDTPGHAAFSAIRSRGARITDLIVLVVAAREGVMAQTREAIQLAQKHHVPLIVALSKCDVAGPDEIQKAKESLMREQVLLEEAGGEVQAVCTSAQTGDGIDMLLQAIDAEAELMELEADPNAAVKASVVESKVVQGRGIAATVLLSQGTLKIGDILVGEEAYCRVRSIQDSAQLSLLNSGPSEPVLITGWTGQPEPGTTLIQVPDEHVAQKHVAELTRLKEEVDLLEGQKLAEARAALDAKLRKMIRQEAEDPCATPRSRRSYDEVQDAGDKRPSLRVAFRADAVGSIEAIRVVIGELPQGKCRVEIVSAAVGPVSLSDVEHANAAEALLVAFNQPVDRAVHRNSPVLKHSVIYHLVDELKVKMAELLPPLYQEQILGQARVLQLFTREERAADLIAGCSILDGTIARNPTTLQPDPGLPPIKTHFRLLRNNCLVIDQIKIKSMRHLKKEIPSARKGMECGILLEAPADGLYDIRPGDVLVQVQVTPVRDKL